MCRTEAALPISDTVFLDADDPLEFRWWNDSIQTRIFTIKVYKGYNMYAGNLIYKNDIPSGDSSVKVDSAVFEDGQVYTWSLIRVSLAGYKSDRSFNSFKVTRGRRLDEKPRFVFRSFYVKVALSFILSLLLSPCWETISFWNSACSRSSAS
jgi:hypothetical protein